MKLLRHGPVGQEKPGVLDPNGNIRDLSAVIDDIAAQHLSSSSLARLNELDVSQLPLVDSSTRLGPCVGGTGKFICIGLNYKDHAAEANLQVPPEPVIFMKATSAICGPNDNVIMPRTSTKLDWEVELGIVIGEHALNVTPDQAEQHIAGYCVINDVSERQFQNDREGQWTKGKSADTFGPTGPYLVTRDEVADPTNLDLWLEVNGHRYQNGNTQTMVYTPAFIVSYLSEFMSLHPGDIISTGTPPGVGLGQHPPTYLKLGDVMSLGIGGLGQQKQTVVSQA
jgi:2-keto-4-pentenoate hydratase/2-oxohepta-3-ene-1,7-dioic acid hydratase in catechol pathway